jgi:hypothetical protein
MRLMLGTTDQPSLLVDIEQEKSPTEFDFWVINGAWFGTFTNGYVTVWHPDRPWTKLDKTEILCNNQDRLRGDYQTVFDNFDNPDYVAPRRETATVPPEWDDDIPF